MTDDYFSWQARQADKGKATRRLPDRRPPALPACQPKPPEVLEHPASTTIVEKLYRRLGRRL